MPSEWHSEIGKYGFLRLLASEFTDEIMVIMPVRETGCEVIVTPTNAAMAAFEVLEWERCVVRVGV